MAGHAVGLPPIIYHDYQVDVGLRIRRKTSGYELEVRMPDAWGGDYVEGLPIPMSSDDMADINELLQARVNFVAGGNEMWSSMSKDERQEAIYKIADVGYAAFKMVFRDKRVSEIIHNVLSLAEEQSLVFEVVSDDFFIPWEVLYPFDPDADPSWKHFWGAQHVIARKIPDGSFLLSSPEIQYTAKPLLGLLTDDQLDAVVSLEIPFFQKLSDDDTISLKCLDPLDPKQESSEFRRFRKFLSRQYDLLHFACHAQSNRDNALVSSITLSSNFDIQLYKMQERVRFGSQPLVLLNACETGNLNPQHTNFFAAAFYRCGARGVVATDCAVPDSFAADFAAYLYREMLAGRRLGEALLSTRLHFLQTYDNPTGLLYSLYARPSIRLVKKGVSDAELNQLFAPLMEAVSQVPADKRETATQKAQALKQEVGKGSQANDSKVAELIQDLVELAPAAVGAITSIFASPVVGAAVGQVAKFVLKRLKR